MSAGIATLVASSVDGMADARVYRVEPPLEGHEHVVVSAVSWFVTETYIFPSDGVGVTGWGELEGSFKGDVDHERALRGAGYEVAS